jgi:hypothetical protein
MMDRMSASRWVAGAVTALACGAAACGTADDRQSAMVPGGAREGAAPHARPSAVPDIGTPTKVDPADVEVVRAWADALRRGDVHGAAEYFALPSLVANGTAPLKLETRAEARFFNRALPCGAEVIATEPAPHGFFIATFRLTERPGPGECGTGTGSTARTAFRVRDRHITDWLRVEDVPAGAQTLS